MGADIHIILEQKRAVSHKKVAWVGIRNFGDSFEPSCFSDRFVREDSRSASPMFFTLSERRYTFFAALAGVRGEGPAPKGLPDDISDLARSAHITWGLDAHSESWATVEEMMLAWATVEEQYRLDKEKVDGTKGDPMNEYLQLTIEGNKNLACRLFLEKLCGVSAFEDDIAYFRFVFWFDN